MRRSVLWLVGCGAVVFFGATTQAQAPTFQDRNGGDLKVGMFVQIPCLVTAITPSLNPATTTVTCQTLPNVGSAEYDDGLSLLVYSSQVLKK